ncbi:MAG: protoporphyrinogen oxidase HemJ [Alphaproteobacteria bacterium]
MDWLLAYQPWIKALHIVSVIAWMAGLLYLPRLFAYHVDASEETGKTFEVMERRLLRAIMNPAMVATFVFGIALLLTPGVADWQSSWLYAKLALVGALTILHHCLALWRKAFAIGENRRSARFFKVVNEVPTVLLIVIVVLVVVRPF